MAKDFLDYLQLHQVLDTVPSGLFLVDREMRIVYWNQAAERITRYPAEEILGKHCSFLQGIPCGNGCGLYNDQIPKPISGTLCSIKTRTGERITILKNVDYLRDQAGEIIGGVESFHDVSRQRKLERSLRRHSHQLEQAVSQRTAELGDSEKRLRTTLDAMQDPAYIISPDLVLEFQNQAMTQLVGEQTGKACYAALYGRQEPCQQCPMAEIARDQTITEERLFPANNRLYEIVHSPFPGPARQVGKLAVWRDITDRKITEQELREANRELDAFAATVSHDLNNLLTPVINYAEFLQERVGTGDPIIFDVLNEVKQAGLRATRLVDDLLSLARVDQIPFPELPIDTEQLADQLLKSFQSQFLAMDMTCQRHPLPKMRIPETLLFQIFSNLIGNALRHGKAPGNSVELNFRLESAGGCLFVRDHGSGVVDADKQRIFDRFYQADSDRDNRGTGLGLAIVEKIARRLGGHCWVEDTPGGGATFCVGIPSQYLE